jgi:hypothetical protein
MWIQFRIFTPFCVKVHFNNVPPSTLRSPKCSLWFKFPEKRYSFRIHPIRISWPAERLSASQEVCWLVANGNLRILMRVRTHGGGEKCLQGFGWDARRQETTGKT